MERAVLEVRPEDAKYHLPCLSAALACGEPKLLACIHGAVVLSGGWLHSSRYTAYFAWHSTTWDVVYFTRGQPFLFACVRSQSAVDGAAAEYKSRFSGGAHEAPTEKVSAIHLRSFTGEMTWQWSIVNQMAKVDFGGKYLTPERWSFLWENNVRDISHRWVACHGSLEAYFAPPSAVTYFAPLVAAAVAVPPIRPVAPVASVASVATETSDVEESTVGEMEQLRPEGTPLCTVAISAGVPFHSPSAPSGEVPLPPSPAVITPSPAESSPDAHDATLTITPPALRIVQRVPVAQLA